MVDAKNSPLFQFQNWRCITKTECRQKMTKFPGETIQDKAPFRSYNNQCLASCPGNTKEALDKNGTPICEECKDCPKKCSGGRISGLDMLQELKDCTHIQGHLTIQLSGCKKPFFFLPILNLYFKLKKFCS